MQKRTVRLLFCPIKKVSIPSKVQKIGKNAFYGCSGLKYLTVKTKKLTSKTVGKGAFKKLNKKAKIKVPKSKLKLYAKILKSRFVLYQIFIIRGIRN